MPAGGVLRARHSRSLDDEPPATGSDLPRVSIIIPARNEAHNIGRCASSALASSYANLEVIVVDDHSTDDTGAIVRALADRDPRLRVVTPAPLPEGWFGKQWACAAGAAESTGDIFGFMDADTWQAPDLVPRIVQVIRSRTADLVTVAGRQELGSFWERVLQPQVFSMMLQRFGGTESVNESPRVSDKIANGQCMFFTRDAYLASGGHASVRDKVAEDLALAQRFFRDGRTTVVVLGLDQLSTRMYTSLAELVRGWGKNIYAGGVDAMPLGAAGRVVFPLLLLSAPIGWLLPPLMLALGLLGVVGAGALWWGAITTAIGLAWWVLVNRAFGLSPLWALLFPLGAAVFLYITVGAIGRGRTVRWKGREYRTT